MEMLLRFSITFFNQCSQIEISPLNAEQLCDISITETEVYEALAALKPNKAPRPDNIHSQVATEELCWRLN